MEMAMKDTSCTRLIGDVEYQPENDTNKRVWSRVKEVLGTILINGVAEERLGLPKGLVVRGWAPRVVRITNNHILKNIDAILHIEVNGPEPLFWFQNNSKLCHSELREEIEARISGTIEWDETCDAASTQYDTTEKIISTTPISVGSTATTTSIPIESTITTVSSTTGSIGVPDVLTRNKTSKEVTTTAIISTESNTTTTSSTTKITKEIGAETTTKTGGLDFHEYVEIEQGTGSSFIGIEAVIITVGINIAIIAICFILIIGIKNSKRKRRHMEADAHQMVYQVYDDVVPVIEGETPDYEESSQRNPDAHASEEKKSAEDSQSYDASDTKGAKVIGAPSDKHAKSAST
nr:unnamed protein product [Haemonchus contortus]